MDTVSKTRKMRKFGSLAAGVVLCLGIANMPSSLAADGVMTTNPSSGWVQGGKTALRIEGTGCVGSKANPAIDVIVSQTASMDDGWSILVAKEGVGAGTINEDGTWSYLLTTENDDVADRTWTSVLRRGMSEINGGGHSTVYAWCVNADETVRVEYAPVDVAVTGVDAFTVTLGEDQTVWADGFTPGNMVTFTLSGATSNSDLADMVIGSGTVDEYGYVTTATINIPASVELGDYTLTVSDGIRTFVSGFTVVGTEEECVGGSGIIGCGIIANGGGTGNGANGGASSGGSTGGSTSGGTGSTGGGSTGGGNASTGGSSNGSGSTGNATKDNNTPKMPDLGTGVA